MQNLNLCLHMGATVADLSDAGFDHVPQALGNRHAPLPHRMIIDRTLDAMNNLGLNIVQEQHALSHDNNRYFGMLQVENDSADFATVVGLRASHDQKFSAGITAGSGVFVCDNLCFSGEVKLQTKQTLKFAERLPDLAYDAVNLLTPMIEKQQVELQAFKDTDINERRANASITHMLRTGVINTHQISTVISEWDNPSHEEFAENKNVWRLFNAITESYKPKNRTGNNLGTLQAVSPKAHAFCNELVAAA